jgi:hypothetical protein
LRYFFARVHEGIALSFKGFTNRVLKNLSRAVVAVAKRRRRGVITLEQLSSAKFARIKLRQNALWAIFSDRKVFFVTLKFLTFFNPKGLFQ